MRSLILPVVLLTALAGPAMAQDATDDAPASPISGTIDNYVVFDATAPSLTTDHSVTVTLAAPVGEDVTVGGDVTLGFDTDLGAGSIALDDPEVVLRLASLMAGTFEAIDAGTALGTACLTPAGGSSNFGTEDLMTFGTCTGYDSEQSILYTSPEMSGWTLYLSGMADPRGIVAAGDIDTAISAALGYSEELGEGTLSLSFGIDKALSLKGGGGPWPTLVQAGSNYEIDGWTLGATGQVELASLSGGNSWSAGIGAGKEVVENLTLTAELAADGYEDAGTPMNEYSLGLTAEYAIIPDSLSVDAGVNVIRTIGGGSDTTSYSAGAGLYYTQAF